MNLYKNDDQEHVWADFPPLGYWEVEAVPEYALPTSMSDDEIDEWLKTARIVAGLWMGPKPVQVSE